MIIEHQTEEERREFERRLKESANKAMELYGCPSPDDEVFLSEEERQEIENETEEENAKR